MPARIFGASSNARYVSPARMDEVSPYIVRLAASRRLLGGINDLHHDDRSEGFLIGNGCVERHIAKNGRLIDLALEDTAGMQLGALGDGLLYAIIDQLDRGGR